MALIAMRRKEPLTQKVEVRNAPAQVVQIDRRGPETINLQQTSDQVIIRADSVVLQIDNLEMRPNINLTPRVEVHPTVVNSVVNVPKAPPAVINLTLPESPPPVIEVKVPPAPTITKEKPPTEAVIEHADGTRSTVELK